MSRIRKIFKIRQKKNCLQKAVFDLQKPSGWAGRPCGHACGALVGPAVGMWGLWCRSVGPVVEGANLN
jgi:hypothetical protein